MSKIDGAGLAGECPLSGRDGFVGASSYVNRIPESWVGVSIGSVSSVIGGGTPPSKEESCFAPPGEGIPWITPADLSGYKKTVIRNGKRDLTEKGLRSCSAKKMPKGSVLFSSRAPVGYVAIAGADLTTNQGFKSFVFPDGVDSRFAYYQLRYLKPVAEAMATGTTFKELSGAAAAKLPFALAPLNEQHRIADKLDRVLARVDAANEHLSRVGVLLKKFRSAVLEAAISGWLVDNEFELDGFDEVRASELRSFRGADLPLLPESWAWLPFGSVAQVVSDLRDPSGYGDFIHLAPNNIEPWTGVVSGCRTIAEDGVFSPKHVFRAGQIVYSKIRPNLCKVAIPEFSGLCSADMYPIETRLDERYLLLYMLSDRFTGWASNSDSRTVLPKINKKDLYSIPVPVPLSLSEQKAITSKVHVLLSIEREVTGALQVAKSQVDELIPSLLAKAFRGELAPQNPDDEPSSELLARLAEAKASENHSPTRRKRQASV